MRRFGLALCGVLAITGLALWPAGCTRAGTQSGYEVLQGTVRAVNAETGELAARVERESGELLAGRDVACVITKDTEIYIDDRFSAVGEIAEGDPIELVGYRDGDRFVISFASVIRRAARPAPDPLAGGRLGGRSAPEE